MAAFLVENMAPLMFAALVLFLLMGFPVAFALAANGLLFGLIGIELGLLTPALFQALLTMAFFPAVAWMLIRVHRAFLQG